MCMLAGEVCVQSSGYLEYRFNHIWVNHMSMFFAALSVSSLKNQPIYYILYFFLIQFHLNVLNYIDRSDSIFNHPMRSSQCVFYKVVK